MLHGLTHSHRSTRCRSPFKEPGLEGGFEDLDGNAVTRSYSYTWYYPIPGSRGTLDGNFQCL